MFNLKFLILFLFTILSQPALADQTANEWVKVADSYRQTNDNMKVSTRVRLLKNGVQSKEKMYQVFIKPDRQSLVLFQSSGEKGQKVLMMADKFWMIMPKSRRPIRITPMQKLLGEASTGDIATMSWHDDYDAVSEGQKEINGAMLDVLKLTAITKGVSYKSIRLYLQPETHKPVMAELYVSSGKLAKTASFETGFREGREQVTKMVLTDAIQKGRVTEVEYQSSEAYTLSAKYYNPQYLAKNRKLKIK